MLRGSPPRVTPKCRAISEAKVFQWLNHLDGDKGLLINRMTPGEHITLLNKSRKYFQARLVVARS